MFWMDHTHHYTLCMHLKRVKIDYYQFQRNNTILEMIAVFGHVVRIWVKV